MTFQHLLFLALALGNDPNTIPKCFNFGVGATLATLLLILALRSGEKQRAVRLGFALCTLTFTVSACIALVGYSVSQSFQSPVVVLATDFAFFAAVAWPVTILGLWAQGSFSSEWRRKLGRTVIGLATLSAVILSIAHIAGLLPTRTEYGMASPLDALLGAIQRAGVLLGGRLCLLAGPVTRMAFLDFSSGALDGHVLIDCPHSGRKLWRCAALVSLGRYLRQTVQRCLDGCRWTIWFVPLPL